MNSEILAYRYMAELEWLVTGASNVPKMTEGGDRVYAKTPTMKKHSEQELQQIAHRASKSIPGAARCVFPLKASQMPS